MASPTDSRKLTTDADGRITKLLLEWYDVHHRELPWRTPPSDLKRGIRPNPYNVWLSEIMLQQTKVEAVKPYFRAFLEKWPDVGALAAAETEDVMKAWAGLGYYSRARNLKVCAEIVARLPGGSFPDSEDGLRALPGIGAYTAAAIASIAFNRPAVVVDGNIERVVTRLFSIATPLPQAKVEIRAHVKRMLATARFGDFAQTMMDLGATICTPRRPRCMLCPLRSNCSAVASGDPEFYPFKLAKAKRLQRRGAAFVAVRSDGAVLLRKRPGKGLLGGMTEVPTTDWTSRVDGGTDTESAPFAAKWQRAGRITHVFTHFSLDLDVFHAEAALDQTPDGHFWSNVADLAGEALPSVMKKVIEATIPGATKRAKP